MTEEEERRLKKKRTQKGIDQWMVHDVKKLVQLACINLPEPYLRLLWLFEGKAVWSGRYPAASSAPKSVRLDDNGLADFIQYPDPSDQVMVRELFRILESELERLMPAE